MVAQNVVRPFEGLTKQVLPLLGLSLAPGYCAP